MYNLYNVPLWQHFLWATIATCGLSVFFKLKRKMLIPVSLVGGLGWIIYVIGSCELENASVYSFLAGAFIGICAEIMARKMREPAITIVIPGILPLVPGLGLYNTVYLIIQKKYWEAASTGTRTFCISLGIAMGILIMASFSKVFNLYQLKRAFAKTGSIKYVDWVNFGKNRTRNRFIINKNEMNDSLNSMNIDFDKNKKPIEKMERSATEDFAIEGKINHDRDNNDKE